MKIRKFNESEEFIKSPQEFKKMKNEVLNDIDKLLIDYESFIRQISPKYWRTSGTIFKNIHNMREDILRMSKQLTMKDLNDDFVRDEILTDEQKKLWNTLKQYNL